MLRPHRPPYLSLMPDGAARASSRRRHKRAHLYEDDKRDAAGHRRYYYETSGGVRGEMFERLASETTDDAVIGRAARALNFAQAMEQAVALSSRVSIWISTTSPATILSWQSLAQPVRH